MRFFFRCFGFSGSSDFIDSFIHIKLFQLSIPLTVIGLSIEKWIGIKGSTLIALLALVGLELISGIYSSVGIKKEKLSSSRFSRFGFKAAVWLILLMVIFQFKNQWAETNVLLYNTFDWFYDLFLSYIVSEYLISVLENVSAISGKSTNPLIQAIKKKLNTILKSE